MLDLFIKVSHLIFERQEIIFTDQNDKGNTYQPNHKYILE